MSISSNTDYITTLPSEPVTTIGRVVHLNQKKHYNGHICHSEQLDGTFQPTASEDRVKVRIVGASKQLVIHPRNIVPLSMMYRPCDQGESLVVLTHETCINLVRDDDNKDSCDISLLPLTLTTLLDRIQLIGHVSVLIDKVISYLCINRVDSISVRAVATSSVDTHANIHNTLDKRIDRWWISKMGSRALTTAEEGGEWVSYDLCPVDDKRKTVVRVNVLRLVIPPLPHGPLSVRKFRLDVSDTSGEKEGPWTTAIEELTTLDSGEVQEWSIYPPIESKFVRIVCKENAEGNDICIGFFTIGFS